jgi:succinylglutamate desuccinylase
MTGSAAPTHETAREHVVASYDARRPGPTLVCVGGLHANEPAGLEAATRVIRRLERERPGAMLGRIVALAGNMRAGERADPDLRSIDRDLNRMWTDPLVTRVEEADPATLRHEHAEMREIAGALRRIARETNGPALLADLHTTSADSPPFVFIEDALPARRLARFLGVPVVLGFEEEIDGLLVDWVTRALGLPAMVIEGGRHDDPSSIDLHEAAIWMLLEALGALPAGAIAHEVNPRTRLRAASGPRAGRFYDVRHREELRDAAMHVDESLGAFSPVRARRTVVAREPGREIIAPTSGLLFMPNRQRDRRIGDDAFFIVLPVGRFWLALSAFLRRRRLVHALLPRISPGVRARPGRSGELLVAPEIAAIGKRELFHLLGYRLLRHGPDVHLPRRVRAWRAGAGLLRALARMGAGLVRGGEPNALPGERADDWVVARRSLDLAEERARRGA